MEGKEYYFSPLKEWRNCHLEADHGEEFYSFWVIKIQAVLRNVSGNQHNDKVCNAKCGGTIFESSESHKTASVCLANRRQ